MHLLITAVLTTILAAPEAPVAAVTENAEVTGIKAAYRNGQTFVTFKDVAEGEAGANVRYSLYRADQPITQDNLDKAELCYTGVFNNSAKMIGAAYNTLSLQQATDRKAPGLFGASRLNPNTPAITLQKDGKATPTTCPTMVIEEGGSPLPMWSGVAVHTVAKDGKGFYAVVATDLAGKAISKVVPGQSATTEAVDEKVAPIQPIKMWDSKALGQWAANLCITGAKGLPMQVSVHASNSTGGLAGGAGDYYIYFGTPDMGYRDGLPGAFCVSESRPGYGIKGENTLVLANRDTIEAPSGTGPMETFWFGYVCVPQWAKDKEPRAYPFTENRVLWSIDWTIKKYAPDTNRIYGGGQSMGGWGSTSLLFRQASIFAGVWPTLPRTRQRGMPSLAKVAKAEDVTMPDGKTRYFDRMDTVKFVSEHHEDLPFYGWSIGRHDGYASWKEQIDMVKALTASHHGFGFSWNDGGHSEGVGPMGKVRKYYQPAMFAMNKSYPAFGNSSINDDLGTGELVEQVGDDGKKKMGIKDGKPEGSINLGFIWADLVDEAGKWEVKLSNDLCKEPMTVDVTPRRCQAFKVKAGDKVKWTNSAGGAGDVTVDEFGLVTITKLAIKPGEATTLTISK
ncbi:MAG: hypothetical protein PHU85_17185 [Phycisphaerae bacterium]|nr:hypothetical protein [Phycisphaerae bacterium]